MTQKPKKSPPLKFDAESSDIIGRANGLRGRVIRVRSKMSGFEGLAYPDDPHVYVEGPNVAGWYRRNDLPERFLKLGAE